MLRRIDTGVGPQILIEGRRFVNFGGSSYLGLSSHPEILEAGITALREYGAGIPVPRNHDVISRGHLEVELEAARFFGSESALFMGSGYYFGLVCMAALRRDYDVIFFDELCHYSLRDGIAASGLRSHSFRHLDVDDLGAQLRNFLSANQRPLVATDGMFSTFGQIAPLRDLQAVIGPYGGCLLVDESHSFGVLGQTGRGAAEHHGLDHRSLVIGGSLGKAFGTCGGIVPGKNHEIESFRATPAGRGATPGTPATAAMCATSLRYVREHHPELIGRLRRNVKYMKSGLRALGLEVSDSMAPVATFSVGPDRSPR
jgi:8-amino-7-oxononanoate synthase